MSAVNQQFPIPPTIRRVIYYVWGCARKKNTEFTAPLLRISHIRTHVGLQLGGTWYLTGVLTVGSYENQAPMSESSVGFGVDHPM